MEPGPPDEPRRFEAPQPRRAVVEVPGLGTCEVREPSMAVERLLVPYYAEQQVDASEFVDLLLASTIDLPRLSRPDIRRIPEPSRAALRFGAAEACGLPNSVASAESDEALLAAMRVRWAQLNAQFREVLAPLRFLSAPSSEVVKVLRAVRERALEVARSVDWQHLIGQLATVGDRARLITDFFRTQPLAFVVYEMRSSEGLDLLVRAEELGNQVVADAIDRGLLQASDFLNMVHHAVVGAKSLHPVHIDELSGAIAALEEGRPWPVSCRLLLGGVEGMLWHAAEQEGVTDSGRWLLKSAGPTRPQSRRATNVTSLLDETAGFDSLGREFRLFLDDVLFDGDGQDMRHGRALAQHREYACWALVALCGWLDRREGTQLMDEAGNRLDALLSPEPNAAPS